MQFITGNIVGHPGSDKTPEAQVKWSQKADKAQSREGAEQPVKASWRRWASGGAARLSRSEAGNQVGRGPAMHGSA